MPTKALMIKEEPESDNDFEPVLILPRRGSVSSASQSSIQGKQLMDVSFADSSLDSTNNSSVQNATGLSEEIEREELISFPFVIQSLESSKNKQSFSTKFAKPFQPVLQTYIENSIDCGETADIVTLEMIDSYISHDTKVPTSLLRHVLVCTTFSSSFLLNVH
jgi:hypothetical protein